MPLLSLWQSEYISLVNIKMKVLFVSGELIAGDLAYRLKLEGCEVKLFIADASRKDCFENMVEKVADWRKELDWVGKDGLIVFDDIGYGKIQDELRAAGYQVIGGSEGGDKIEKDREFAQKTFAEYGIEVEESKDFLDADLAIEYIRNHPGKWVVKQNEHDGSLAYVGQMTDGRDSIGIIRSLKEHKKASQKISLQRKAEGIEIAIARFFNGNDWTSPLLFNIEHKYFLNENLGPLTAEMGTLAWSKEDENNKLFQVTLAKIKPYLQEVNYRGFVDINSIVNKDKLSPLEATARFGSPTNHLQSELYISPWKNLLLATAKGESFELKTKSGYSIVVSVAIPPFPYKAISSEYYLKGVDIFFNEELTKEEWSRVHFEEVSMRKGSGNQLYITGSNGYILYITGSGNTVQEAREQVYQLVHKLVVPKMMYRTDIGVKFAEKDKKLLTEWGWI